jgi:hypothetical protein
MAQTSTATLRCAISSVIAVMCIACFASTQATAGSIEDATILDIVQSALKMGGSLKSTTLVSHHPDDPVLFPDRWTGTQLLRLRLNVTLELADWAEADLSYEQRAWYVTSEDAGRSAGVLPSFASAPYRIWQLDWQLAEVDDRFFYRHELDRAAITLQPKWGSVVIGRQAIGLGRGVLFSAVDMFSPFTPAEVDREWRRGVDAVRVEARLTETSSAEFITVFGEAWDDSAVIGRVRGFTGNVDGEIVLGKRAEDLFVAGITSAALGDAEVHLELALFHTPEQHPDGGLFANDHLVGKAVLGCSYTFDIGNGLTVLGEYHYSGFGVEDTSQLSARLHDPTFQERLLRGDFQILGQHALGVQASYTIDESFSAGGLVLNNPVDGSGLFSPILNWDITEQSSMRFSVFLPWGAEPKRGQIQSEYGTSPQSLFVQFSTYF